MLQLQVPSVRRFGAARRSVGEHLRESGFADDDVHVLQAIVGELLGAAHEANAGAPIAITIESFARLTSVRVRCLRAVEFRDDPFLLRERVLQGLTLAFGQRRNADGTTDLWAEVPRTVR